MCRKYVCGMRILRVINFFENVFILFRILFIIHVHTCGEKH